MVGSPFANGFVCLLYEGTHLFVKPPYLPSSFFVQAFMLSTNTLLRTFFKNMDVCKSHIQIIPLLSCFPPASQLSLQCMECHIIFSDHKSKERHLKLSHPAEYEHCILRNALFACYVCDRHFTNSTELMAHQKAHTEKNPFKCPICSQAFNKSSELTSHKKIHFGLDGYACTDCGKPCKTMTLLKYHRRTHTGERPYVCKECGKRFTMSKALQKHLESHMSDGAERNGEETTVKAQVKKDDGKKKRIDFMVVLSFCILKW